MQTMSSRIISFGTKALAIGTAGVGITAFYRYQAVKQEESNLPTHELWSFNHHKADKKQCIIIGGGVVGVTAAYKLALKGHSVVLLEPNAQPGKECSACAAGGMQRSNPTVDKGTWISVTKSLIPLSTYLLGGKHEPYKFFHIDWFQTLTDPFFLRWSYTFAKTSLFPCDWKKLQMEQLAFTDYAVRDMVKMMEDRKDPMARKSGYNNTGSLSLSYDAIDTTKKKSATANPTHGNTLEPSKQLESEDIASIEPSITNQVEQPTSAKYEFETCSASSERFTEELASRCASDKKLDVTFLYNTRVKGMKAITTEDGQQRKRVTQIQTNRGVLNVPKDAEVLIAAGSWTPQVAALIDLYAPVYPLKGYAMSISAKEALQSKLLKPTDLPTRIICDKYMFTSRLGDEIRVTSIGEFSGWSTSPTTSVEKEFRKEAVRQFPKLESFINAAKVKCGHRPYVSDGILLLGRVDKFDNLLVSCGPGSNGWKLAMGSGSIVEMLVSGKTEEEISAELRFDVRSLSPAGRVVDSPIFAKMCRARWGVDEKNQLESDSIKAE
jgi:D-amino-acid dehydrogenase